MIQHQKVLWRIKVVKLFSIFFNGWFTNHPQLGASPVMVIALCSHMRRRPTTAALPVVSSQARLTAGALGILSAGKGPLVVTKKIERMNITYSKVANWYMFLDVLLYPLLGFLYLNYFESTSLLEKKTAGILCRWWQRCHGFWLDIPVNQSIDWKYRESVEHVETCRHSFPHKQKPQICCQWFLFSIWSEVVGCCGGCHWHMPQIDDVPWDKIWVCLKIGYSIFQWIIYPHFPH